MQNLVLFNCSHCGQQFQAPQQITGHNFSCPICKNTICLSLNASLLPVRSQQGTVVSKVKGFLGDIFDKSKKPLDLLESYSVIYLGGHPDYPKAKSGFIDFYICRDRFEFLPSNNITGKWFKGVVIPFDTISDFSIEQRQVGTAEGILGGLDSRQLNQANNIHITYMNNNGLELMLRFEMISGFTVMGQAVKCRELMDRLRAHQVLKNFRGKQEATSNKSVDTDIPLQIGKLACLEQQGIITHEEFLRKKADLLARL